ncbi:hypothetical protein AMS68_007059 [Peltaster fructicola]|uniref:AAA+ ATPase domain-containing protein n=1 Tax=Peltaster fructicola TaxID=286661 RepID=A0A6H0Y3F2_9PEZI|nr:hypothetical protein AMS68_007059 [Peltaster fructicola]
MDLSAQRNKRFLDAVLHGKRNIRTEQDAKQFITALCTQSDRVRCVVELRGKENGLHAVEKSLFINLSTSFLNNEAAQFLLYVTSEDVRQVNGGRMLCEVLTSIMNSPLLWDAYRTAFDRRELTDKGLAAFASLLLALLTLLSPSSELASKLEVKATARHLIDSRQLHDSALANVRRQAYQIGDALRHSSLSESVVTLDDFRAGGRHDNDHENFRVISIYPTKDELLSTDQPYILSSHNVLNTAPELRVAVYLDNQFRLLREDMLAELRDDLKSTNGSTTTKRRTVRLRNLQFSGIDCGNPSKRRAATVALRCYDYELTKLPGDETARRKYFANNKTVIKHGSFGCLMVDQEVIAFALLERDEDQLAKSPSVLLLRILGETALRTAVTTLKSRRPDEIEFVMIDTPYFAYEPILARLQNMPSLPLADIILGLKQPEPDNLSPFGLESLAKHIEDLEGRDLSSIIGVSKPICLDSAQTASLVAGLTQEVSQIQGPPGTGKSFIGGIITKLLLQRTQATILVLCYTNHALDQFLEDLLDMGVTEDQALRLGSKSTARTKPMTLYEQSRERILLPQSEYKLCKSYEAEADDAANKAWHGGMQFSRWRQSNEDILASLEFTEQDEHFFNAFSVPEDHDGMTVVGARGNAIGPTYLLDRWLQGQDAGIFKTRLSQAHSEIWRMKRLDRHKHYMRWTRDAITERAEFVAESMQRYDRRYNVWRSTRENRVAELMKSKRILACTTTGAAMYSDQIAKVKPGIVLVEEAGEVLESHILTALSPETKQLCLIGDHLQLRPKVKNYALSVERGDGFDLNRSLFERLILGGHPHSILTKQHRMRPQISALVRRLMYPELEDGESVLSRPDMSGLQKNVIFIDHQHAEVSDGRIKDRQDGTSTASRQNVFEAKMILKIVKYLAQQGYGTDKQVVLTPYLGQLRLIMDELKDDHDPVLSDLDSHDLVKAGLLTSASADLKRQPLRISTIDNFQGEESDVVIVSLTRSNDHGDIGFMSEPQRLNVLLSRARNGLIIIGNSATFRRSKKGSAVWNPFFNQLSDAGLFFSGLPVKCERHPKKLMLLAKPEDFDAYCPNGGCEVPCGALLKCRKHRCPERCHKLVDHSKQQCLEKVEIQCSNGHKTVRACWSSSQACFKCKRDEHLQKMRQQAQDDYLAKLIAMEDKIKLQRDVVQDLEDQVARANVLKQKEEDLAAATRSAQLRLQIQSQGRTKPTAPQAGTHNKTSPTSTSAVEPGSDSDAAQAWAQQKKSEDADNEHIDAIMALIGLESVKQQILNIKDKVDTSLRQNASLAKERFNILLLGNPGTGKTTVARHYAKCLASMGVVAGSNVRESTASKLTNGGVSGYKTMIDDLLNSGGGAMFIDEAYQLTAGTGGMGRQVLDAIMDDAENLVGKVVFILAGYRKEMETLLAHNPGLTSRFPHEFSFQDYTDDELLRIFEYQIRQTWNGQMKLEDGARGLYARIVARRVGYGRGRPGFGNARAVENTLQKIRTRQSARLTAERRQGQPNDDFMMVKEDMLGPEPSSALQESKAWKTLQELIGLATVKRSVHSLMQVLRINYDRELREEPLVQFNLNKVFLGSPGTGKTTVAKLYGQILADLGLLSNGEVILKNPADFVGDVLGASEKTTKGILSSSVGKVLVIDEAYGLHSSAGVGQSADIYKTAVIDTLVAEIQSVPGDDRCVLLLGYQEQMEKMLRDANPGLARRFPLSEAFVFEDFTDDELREVVKLKLKQQAYDATDDAMEQIMAILQRARNKMHFGNAGEVDIILNSSKARHLQRCADQNLSNNATFEAIDCNPDFNRASEKPFSIPELFKDSLGHDWLITRLQEIWNVVANMKSRGFDPRKQVPYNFVFCGPPGTGKTTTARKMGQIYHEMGILATDEVLERSASDLVGQYVGHTGDKTKKLLESALGKVLLIDEAYRLAEGHFAKEATDELVDLLTKPQFAGKLIVILAGYDRDIERLMATNPGLTSRFPEKVSFQSLSPAACATLLITRLAQESYLDVSAVQMLASCDHAIALFERLTKLSSWANARDVETLAKVIARAILQQTSSSDAILRVTKQHVDCALEDMVSEREQRAKLLAPDAPSDLLPLLQQFAPTPSQPTSQRQTRINATPAPDMPSVEDCQPDEPPSIEENQTPKDTERDDNVSDEVWATLQADKKSAADEDKAWEDISRRCEEAEQDQTTSDDDSDDEDDEALAARRRREQERVRYELLRRQKEEMETKRKHEEKMQQKLKKMGVCCMGFKWIKQASGYRCAGGSHYVSDADLAAV